MISINNLITDHAIKLGISPNEADVAIVSIDVAGTSGVLNSMVMKDYGYNPKKIPSREQLEHAGFAALNEPKKKPIIFVVTIDGRNTSVSLASNLYKALTEFKGWFRNKKLWIPLMGTGDGGLSLEESYSITVDAINKFQEEYPTETTILLSIPENAKGIELFNKINSVSKNDKASNVKDFVTSLNANFYLAGSFWSGDQQEERFYSEKIWEKGQEDESYSSIINAIDVNDIIILKSVFATNNEGYLRVKGVGVVTEKSIDGASVNVDWRLKGLQIDIAGLSKYRNTITEASFEDAVQIFSFIDQTLWQRLLPPSTTAPVNSNKIAGLLSDADKGTDYLDISKDVTAFARVITAKSFDPPLAIALFGKWGSGKSFFMGKLKERISGLAESKTNDMYCKGVVHIHFNAWSYMDANLWASFVSKIFEGLQDYIKKDESSKQLKHTIKEELSKQLNVTKAGIESLQDKKTSVELQIKDLEKKSAAVKKQIQQKISDLKKQTAWDVINTIDQQFDARKKIVESFQENRTFQEAENELREIVPEKYWNNPKEAYEQVKSKHTFLKEFFKREKIANNLLWLGGILAIVFLTPVVLAAFKVSISNIDFTIPQAGISFLVMIGAAWRRAEVVYAKLQPIAASFWKVKQDYEQRKEEALAKFEQDEKALKLEIEKSREEILLYTEQIQKAQTVSAELEFKINNALATETLYSFIDERAKSDDYKKHLGIISTIRKDFEILNGLFVDHKSEIVDQKQAEKFRRYFTNPVERIILYVDDLDRCPEENVVQVLEAVNLLMAFPLFVVIVGVDPRWVKNALIKKYALQFTGKINGGFDNEKEVEVIEPSNYLEKIFQVPFHLKDAPPKTVRDMIQKLATSKPVAKSTGQIATTETSLLKPDVVNEGRKIETAPKEQSPTITDSISLKDELTVTVIETIELLELSETEVELLQDMGDIVGPNPRALKRFVNIYKIIKAHEDYTISDASPREDLLAVIYLLALASGQFKVLAQGFESFNKKATPGKVMVNYFNTGLGGDADSSLKQSLKAVLLENDNLKEILSIEQSVFDKHQPFIKRFTFKSI